MFCTSLRRRPSFAPAVPRLIGAGNLGLRESQLTTHDLVLPIGPSAGPNGGRTRQLRALLLSPSATTDDALPQSIERIRHFALLTGGQDLVIVFLLKQPAGSSFTSARVISEKDSDEQQSSEDGVVAYTKLQTALLDQGDVPHIPTLLLVNLDGLPDLLKSHTAALNRPRQKTQPQTSPFALLQLCTANPPMPQQTAFILSDLFPNLSELAAACTAVSSAPNSSSPSARAAWFSSQITGTQDTQFSDAEGFTRVVAKFKQLRDLIGEEQCTAIVEFWREEWTVD